MKKYFQNIYAVINGVQLTNSAVQHTFNSINPAQFKDVIGTFSKAQADDCIEACKSAQYSLERWKLTPAPVRAQIIQNFGILIGKNKNALARIISQEMGKPLREAEGEVQEAIDTCNFFVSEGRRLYGQTIPSEMPNKELYTYRRPIGVFACITAANFPFAVPSWYFIPALVCGNTCVWKPSEETPVTSIIFTELLHAAGLPNGVFNTVFGDKQTGQWLLDCVEKGLIDKVGFTGSSSVGKTIGEICGRNLQTPCLELGGKNPLVVCEDADLDLAAHGILWSGFGTAGQRCTSLGNLIVHNKIKEKLLTKVLDLLQEIQIGDPSISSNFYGPMIGERFLNDHCKNLEVLIKNHHRIITRFNGKIMQNQPSPMFKGQNPEEGFYAFPTIVDNVQKSDLIYSTETFGPLFNVINFESMEEAIHIANDTGYGLSSAIYTKNIKNIYQFKSNISAGMLSINNSTTGAEAHLPFGGNGKSGNGSRQSGIWVIDQFTKWQAVNWDMSDKLQLAQMDTDYISPKDYQL